MDNNKANYSAVYINKMEELNDIPALAYKVDQALQHARGVYFKGATPEIQEEVLKHIMTLHMEVGKEQTRRSGEKGPQDPYKTVYGELIKCCDDIKWQAEHMMSLTDSKDELGEGLNLMKMYENFLTFIYTNMHPDYREWLVAALKEDPAYVVDEFGRNMAKDLYDGKFFYEVVNLGAGEKKLVGPLDNVYYIKDEGKYTYCQIVDKQVTVAFTKDEILVMDRQL